MIEIKIIAILICGGLNLIGGYCWHDARRFLMPILLAGACIYFAHTFWAITMLLAIPALTIGYGDKSPLRHIFGDAWARFVWMALVALGLALGLTVTHHIIIALAAAYILIAGALGITLRNWNEILGDFIFGCWFGVIALLTTS